MCNYNRRTELASRVAALIPSETGADPFAAFGWVDAKIQDEFQSSYQESMIEEEAELFHAAMLGNLPPLHYIAKISGGCLIKGRLPILQCSL